MKSFCNLLKIKQLKTTPYHPQSNGVKERFCSLLKIKQLKTTPHHPQSNFVLERFCRLLKIKQFKTTPHLPQSNGILERWHRCLKQMLRKIDKGQSQLQYCLLAYRETPHKGNPPHGYWLLPISLAYRATPHMVTYHWLIGQPPIWLLVTPHITGL